MAVASAIGAVTVPACDKAPLLAPTSTTITLFAGASVLPVNGTTELFATVIESAGTPVQNGTVVRFTTDLGTIDPVEARTQNGQATAVLRAGSASGTATLSAISGSARATDVQVQIGGATAANLAVSANPAAVPSTGGTVEVTAVVTDADGNRVSGVPVSFASTAGQLSDQSVLTDANGEARTRLTTTRDASVTASVAGLQQTISVPVENAPTVSLSTQTGTPTVGQSTTFTITVGQGTSGSAIERVTVDFGDGQSQVLGALVGTLNVGHIYDFAGTFVVTVTATDVSAAVTSVSTSVQVSASAVSVVVSASPTSPSTNAVVSLTATVTPSTATVAEYRWDFGDGETAVTTGGQTTHVYSAAGRKIVRVTVQTTDGRRASGQTEVAVGLTTGALSVAVTASPTSPATNAVVSFTATVTPTTASVVSYTWDFGDGETSVTSAGQASHIYASAGRRTVIVTALAADGSSATGQAEVAVGLTPGGVALTLAASPTNPSTNAVVSFTATVTPSSTPILSYEWDFGDDQTTTTSGNQTTHIYAVAGRRTVRVTAQAADGTLVSAQTEVAVGVTSGPVSVTIAASPTNPSANSVVSLTATVTPSTASVVSYEWNFGDGTEAASSGNQINHVYTASGAKTVDVTVTLSDGQQVHATTTVLVS